MVVLNLFYKLIISHLGMKYFVKHRIFANVWYRIKSSSFQPLEGVDRGSETQLQVGEIVTLQLSG